MIDQAAADTAVAAVHAGDTEMLGAVLRENPGLSSARLPGHGGRTLLHVATDWPGHFPRVADTIRLLIASGAGTQTPFMGPHAETALHWAASSGDMEALEALLAGCADVNAPGAVIGGGTPMADATAFGQWAAARRLLEGGSRTSLFEAAALGQVDRVAEQIAREQPTPQDLTGALWGACHGGQEATAELLIEHGADVNWVGYDGLTPLDAAERAGAAELAAWLAGRGALTSSQIEAGEGR